MQSKARKLCIAMSLATMCIGGTSFAAIEPGYITPHDSNLTGSNVVYTYDQNNQFKVRGKLGYLTDLTLGRNEKLTSIVAGNTDDWKVSTAVVDQTPHVYLKPVVKEAKTTNLIVNTNKRSYRFIVRQDEYYDDVVSFNNLTPAVDSTTTISQSSTQKDSTSAVQQINRDYKYEKAQNVRKTLIPNSIWDDGIKTYIEVPTTNIRNLPVVYSVDKKGKLSMVNSRLQGHYIVIDTVLARLQLRFKTDSYLTVVNNKEAGVKPVKVKELNQTLNQVDIVPSVPNDEVGIPLQSVNIEQIKTDKQSKSSDLDQVKQALQQSIKDTVNHAKLDIQGKPRIIITRDSDNNPVSNVTSVATTNPNHSIDWVPLKDRIANLQKGGTK
ncbi:MAG: TrbG/VirB9 family P-type conjugative transfer protein [Clostridiales bacterium]|nr:TrbG/VirB9 family P-type conjugative transfer protein [Clostridiales bacterium]